MTRSTNIIRQQCGHRTMIAVVLCLFGLYMPLASQAQNKGKNKNKQQDDRVYLLHADELMYNIYGNNPEAQIVKGKVAFSHQGANLTCDSAYFYQEANSVSAFGHVHFRQGDTLSLDCERAYYDGQEQMMRARSNVVLKHRQQTLYTDSLDYDRLYNNAYFFEGGRLVDGKDKLISDWGEYNTQTREAKFYYNVHMVGETRDVKTDTLLYNTRARVAHVLGPSVITSGTSTVNTEDGYFDTKSDKAELFSRSTIVDQQKTITGDTLFHDNQTGLSEGFGNVIYVDSENKNELHCGHMEYNNLTGYGYATKDAMVMDYSQPDTLYMHADSLKLYTYNINTDSVKREVHCFDHVRAYRIDVQAVCDSLVFNSADSCMTMYKDPIVWNGGRQLLGEVVRVYMNDSTIRLAHVIGQALSVEKVDEQNHYNQISSHEMLSHFVGGAIRKAEAISNVRTIFYPIDDKDSSIIAMNYLETEKLVMKLSETRQLDTIWAPKCKGTMYPLTQIPPNRRKLPSFAWFDNIRPVDKDDIFNWRGKNEEDKLKIVERHKAPLQTLQFEKPEPETQPAIDIEEKAVETEEEERNTVTEETEEKKEE
ncbi:MAG: hypothetical protein IJS97_09015 [Prevotella sp.]|nr:hypothetical protein [Prevotella sp.]